MATKDTGGRNPVLSRSVRRKIQNFLLVWLDANINEPTPDLKNSLAQLRRIVASIETYKDAEECIQFIQQVKDQKVFMIVSGSAGQNAVPTIHEWDQIDSIYVFCGNKPFHEKWSKNYLKVKGVHTSIEPICKALEIDRQRCEQNIISVSFQSGDPLFMYTQLVKEAILQIDYDEAVSLKELVAFCRQQEDINDEEIKMVEKDYKKHKPIWWYTAPIFMYSMLNRGLRVFDVDILMKMGFFMSQLDRHIQELSKQQHADPNGLTIIGKAHFQVYRGQGLSNENFEKLKKTKGGLMSFNNFLSTSYNKDVSLRDFAQPAALLTDSVGILFIMRIDTELCKKANISFVEITGSVGYFKDKEAEILFSTHTLFKVEKVQQITHPHTYRLYQVNLTVASPDTQELHEVAETMRKEIGTRTGLSSLGLILNRSGQSEQAKDIYHALLEKATLDKDIAEYNYQLGWVYNNLGEYNKAIQYYELDFEYKQKTLPPNHPNLAASYNKMGEVYSNILHLEIALAMYEKSLEIQKQALPSNHPDLATSYNNIGTVCWHMYDYSKALTSCQQSLEIRKQALPQNHPDLATSYNNIGTVRWHLYDYSKALTSFQKALEIRKQVLLPNHPDLATSYNSIGGVYHSMGDYSKALSSYQQSLEIKKKILPPNHPELATSYNKIGTVYKNMGDYSKALSLYQQSIEIWEQVLPPNHPDLADSYNNIGLVYENISEYTKALQYYEKALQIWETSLFAGHSYITTVKQNIEIIKKNM